MAKTSIKDLLRKSTKVSIEEKELQLALELSAKEQVNEQKKLLEQFAKKCKRPMVTRKQRIIKQDIDDDHDQWFQTVSTRPQSIKPVKKESVPFQFDLNSIMQESSDDEVIIKDTINDKVDEDRVHVDRVDVQQSVQMISDSDSDSSIIDLVNTPAISDREDDDGYLSPLEGFVSLENNETQNPFLDQLQPTIKRKRATSTTIKKPYKKRNKWARKRKR